MQWYRKNRPNALPVDDEALHDGLNLIAEQDPELTRDARRKALAATYEFEDYSELALITQTIHVSFASVKPLIESVAHAKSWRLPVWPALSSAGLLVSVVSRDGSEHPISSDQIHFATRQRPRLAIIDRGSLPAAMSDHHSTLQVEYQAGFGADHSAIPADIAQAIISQAALMQDAGWNLRRGHTGLSPHTARIAARYRGVRL
jgi:hypothetical protein